MERKEFDSFERLGKELDLLVGKLGKLKETLGCGTAPRPGEEINASNFEKRLADVFVSGNFLSLETENVPMATLDGITDWINSKVPVQNASNAHILYTTVGVNKMVCVFFSDKEMKPFIGNEYPMKRIVCNGCDPDLEAFLNGKSFISITI